MAMSWTQLAEVWNKLFRDADTLPPWEDHDVWLEVVLELEGRLEAAMEVAE